MSSLSDDKKRSIVLHSQKSWRCRFFLRKHNKKTGRKHLFLSMSKNAKKLRKYKAVCDRVLGKDVLIVICAGEDGARIGADGEGGARRHAYGR